MNINISNNFVYTYFKPQISTYFYFWIWISVFKLYFNIISTIVSIYLTLHVLYYALISTCLFQHDLTLISTIIWFNISYFNLFQHFFDAQFHWCQRERGAGGRGVRARRGSQWAGGHERGIAPCATCVDERWDEPNRCTNVRFELNYQRYFTVPLHGSNSHDWRMW